MPPRRSYSAPTPLTRDRFCYFCANNLSGVDYKETGILQRFTSSYGKIVPRRKSGVCAWHQRAMAEAIKRARFMALLPYVRGQK
jgi:small subunit ribosomal protein S18